MVNIDLNKKSISSDCRGMILILKEKLAEMKAFLLAHPFESEADSRTYFLDEMQQKLNKRMERDDEKERNRR